ncbi:hypothetical protein [Streptomyces sp. NPDC003077]|uniref:hypothetical protein n=1 Tax=Streptomyces sp. NPDC003077 TaxID=3154443 RepID=UPI0033A9DEE5
MKSTFVRRTGVAVAALALTAGLSSCQSGSDKAQGDEARRTPVQAITATFKKMQSAKAAKVDMTMTMPGASGEMKMSGVMGWDPQAIDMTVTMPAAATQGKVTAPVRMIQVDGAMYTELTSMKEALPPEMAAKKWAKIDMAAIAKKSGNEKLLAQLTGGAGTTQDPAQQLAPLLESPNVKHVGTETVNGVSAEHYTGSVSVEEALKEQEASKLVTPELRERQRESIKKLGVKKYDIDIWVNSDDYPVKMKVGMDTKTGPMNLVGNYSDYGTKANVQAPPAADTLDILKEIEKQLAKADAKA